MNTVGTRTEVEQYRRQASTGAPGKDDIGNTHESRELTVA